MDFISQQHEAGNGGVRVTRNRKGFRFGQYLEDSHENWKFRVRIGIVAALTLVLTGFGTFGLLKPTQNGCVMTYMYPTYIPILAPKNISSTKYDLYLYHEGWKKIDFHEHLKKLSGVPVLFIPGSSGSYKQVRSVAKESHWAYTTGPLERTYYQEASLTFLEGGLDEDISVPLPNQYSHNLDWFTVNLEGEHSAMDGRILEEHTEYVVYAIHRILDQYKVSREARAREGSAVSENVPKSVILVGHSVGGFVARAAVVHPHLRKNAVETIVSLSSPHQLPPIALQPSIGHYYASVNELWRNGYKVQVSPAGSYLSDPMLSNVVVISISGGINDYQVRTKLESLDGIVPSSHGFMISSTSMKNVWLSMEHQAILWCNQVVVQLSHTLLSLIDSRTGLPFNDSQRRLAVFTRMLHSGIPKNFDWKQQPPQQRSHSIMEGEKKSQVKTVSPCPKNIHWDEDGLEKDLYIQTTTVTVLAMDGRRRWLDIQKLGANGTNHFVLVTNLLPCHGVRLHLWLEKGKTSLDLPGSERAIEVTSKLVQIPSGPAPKQIEPGSQTEQPPPSAMVWLTPKDMEGFRFITISIAPRPTVSGRPPPAASMAVGQFFSPTYGDTKVSLLSLLLSLYSEQNMELKEDHPVAVNISFSVSLGLLPVTMSLHTTGCGIKNSENEEKASRLCKLRCFPPVALAWDSLSGLHVIPNMQSEMIVVDSAPALWSSSQRTEKTIVLLLVDPHCAYRTTYSVSFTAAASRFLLMYGSQIAGIAVASVLFALMRQAHAWEKGVPLPSMLKAFDVNMKLPLPFLVVAVVPVAAAFLLSLLMSQPISPASSFVAVSLSCFAIANGFTIILISVSQLVLYVAAIVQVFFKTRWQRWGGNSSFGFLQRFVNLSSSFFLMKVIRALTLNPLLITALAATLVVCLVHPALGLIVLLVSHALCCHSALCSYLAASRIPTKKVDSGSSKSKDANATEKYVSNHSSCEDNSTSSPESSRSFSDLQLEIFNHRHGLLILHFLAALMFGPSFIVWAQRIGSSQSFPWLLDSILCIGVILHGTCNSKPEFSFFFPLPWGKIRLSCIYMLAGYYSFLSGLAAVPFRAMYAMAMIGGISAIFRLIQMKNRGKGEVYFSSRKHSHRH